jgi:hypothetical protein
MANLKSFGCLSAIRLKKFIGGIYFCFADKIDRGKIQQKLFFASMLNGYHAVFHKPPTSQNDKRNRLSMLIICGIQVF